MKNCYYVGRESKKGVTKGKIYFSGNDRKVTLDSGKKVSVTKLLWDKCLMGIPYYAGEFKEGWFPQKKVFRMRLYDVMSAEDTNVTFHEVHKIGKKGLICLATISDKSEYVQVEVYNKRIILTD